MLKKLSLTKKNIFLFDGCGALWSAITSGLILPFFSDLLGLPSWLLYGLASIAVVYSLFSLAVFFGSQTYRPEFLLAIIFGNISYCVLSVSLIFFWPELTLLGKLVLIAECLIVMAVVGLEIRVLRSSS